MGEFHQKQRMRDRERERQIERERGGKRKGGKEDALGYVIIAG